MKFDLSFMRSYEKRRSYCIAVIVSVGNPLVTLWIVERLIVLTFRMNQVVTLFLWVVIVTLIAVSISLAPLVEYQRDRILDRRRTDAEKVRDAFALLPVGLGTLIMFAGYTSFPLLHWCDLRFGSWYVFVHIRNALVVCGLWLVFIGAFIGTRDPDLFLHRTPATPTTAQGA